MLTKKLLQDVGVRNNEINLYFSHLVKYTEKYKVNTKERLIAFLMNVLHESAYFRVIKENLNYSERNLLTIFPRYFNASTAKEYAFKPVKIANRVYANRMGNGDEASGEGNRYAGKGLIQVTGKNNMKALGSFLGLDLIKYPDLILEPDHAVHSAFWFWETNKLNDWADKEEYKSVAAIINTGRPGGTPIGWRDRENIQKKLEKLI